MKSLNGFYINKINGKSTAFPNKITERTSYKILRAFLKFIKTNSVCKIEFYLAEVIRQFFFAQKSQLSLSNYQVRSYIFN